MQFSDLDSLVSHLKYYKNTEKHYIMKFLFFLNYECYNI